MSTRPWTCKPPAVSINVNEGIDERVHSSYYWRHGSRFSKPSGGDLYKRLANWINCLVTKPWTAGLTEAEEPKCGSLVGNRCGDLHTIVLGQILLVYDVYYWKL